MPVQWSATQIPAKCEADLCGYFCTIPRKMNSCYCQREVVITDNLGRSVNLP